MTAKTLTIKALDKDIKDAYWIDVKKILQKYNLKTEKVDDFYCIKNEKDTAVDPRSYILMLRRESREITIKYFINQQLQRALNYRFSN